MCGGGEGVRGDGEGVCVRRGGAGAWGGGGALGVRCVCKLCVNTKFIWLLQNMNRRGNILHGEMHSLNLNFKRMKTQITLYF